MLVRPPPSLFGAAIGARTLPRCLHCSVPVSNTPAAGIFGSGSRSPAVNAIAASRGQGPSQIRWQWQLLRLNPQIQAQAQTQTPKAPAVTTFTAGGTRLNGLSGRNSSSLKMRLIGVIRLASTSTSTSKSPAAAQKKEDEGVGGEQQRQQCQGQLPPTNAANGVPQLKAPKLEYPERLLIYNAGKGKIIFIALLKLTTVLIFSAFGLFVAPAYIVNGSPLAGAVVFICGLTPFLFLAHSSRPFVAQIHLTKIPPYARLSSDVLLRFARSLPPQSASRLEFITMSLIGKPRVSSVAVSDLRPVFSSASGPSYRPSWLRRVNFVRVDQPTPAAPTTTTSTKGGSSNINKWKLQQVQAHQEKLKEKKKQGWRQRLLSWTRFKSVNEFYVTDVPQKTAEKRGVKEARVWEEVRGLVEKRAVREAERRRK